MPLNEAELTRLGLPLDFFTKPIFETCDTLVTEPTLSFREREVEGRQTRETVMQWYGQSDEMRGDYQFLFPLNIDSAHLMDRPEWFRVPFVGPVREWPNPDAVSSIAEAVTKGDLDGIAVYIVSGNIGVDDGNEGTAIASFAFPLSILLAAPNVGVIRPRTYKNMDIVEQERRKLASRPELD